MTRRLSLLGLALRVERLEHELSLLLPANDPTLDEYGMPYEHDVFADRSRLEEWRRTRGGHD